MSVSISFCAAFTERPWVLSWLFTVRYYEWVRWYGHRWDPSVYRLVNEKILLQKFKGDVWSNIKTRIQNVLNRIPNTEIDHSKNTNGVPNYIISRHWFIAVYNDVMMCVSHHDIETISALCGETIANELISLTRDHYCCWPPKTAKQTL